MNRSTPAKWAAKCRNTASGGAATPTATSGVPMTPNSQMKEGMMPNSTREPFRLDTCAGPADFTCDGRTVFVCLPDGGSPYLYTGTALFDMRIGEAIDVASALLHVIVGALEISSNPETVRVATRLCTAEDLVDLAAANWKAIQ